MDDKDSFEKAEEFMKSFKERYDRGIKAEKNAIKILNSKSINHKWKKDFKKDWDAKENWDLINSEGQKIEVKSTIKPYSFSRNYAKLNTPLQHKQIIMRVLINENGKILDYKFIKKGRKYWRDITKEILNNSFKD